MKSAFHNAKPTVQRLVPNFTQGKKDQHFPIKPGQPTRMALTIFHSYFKFPTNK